MDDKLNPNQQKTFSRKQLEEIKKILEK